MGLRLVGRNDADRGAAPVGVRDVEAEARRRLSLLGYERHRARSLATGIEMPREVHIQHLQIMAIALALSSLDSIPDDYRSDVYWPVDPAQRGSTVRLR
ncbi:hypothetical protein LRX75_06055 [Rhizobium sp. DKSPLA3]|uniref:Uncharacterized protein n=1 Tax=Rhizobium quercicola TaxID=2901226 RepID=A0A9X1NP67_9HYPH|nr:hypothetical protein [Rhizobium quercicola]MCD7108602.1 hypothetical protein [Rhizobium quercicola]